MKILSNQATTTVCGGQTCMCFRSLTDFKLHPNVNTMTKCKLQCCGFGNNDRWLVAFFADQEGIGSIHPCDNNNIEAKILGQVIGSVIALDQNMKQSPDHPNEYTRSM